ncbi:MAG: chemotaxis protein CheW [Firmicutes bacterium]|jgi:purine-binding chemotaxis protein CheW|nr:chemotaxis protein CheW [Bacillota bacterium]
MADNQFVIFKLGREKYCVDISCIGGINDSGDITDVPEAPDYVEGIINLRGDIIPIINLKKKFKMSETGFSKESRIVIINTEENLNFGFIVDDASQVIRIEETDIAEAPTIIKSGKDYISGVVKFEDHVALILDLIKVMTDEERKSIARAI